MSCVKLATQNSELSSPARVEAVDANMRQATGEVAWPLAGRAQRHNSLAADRPTSNISGDRDGGREAVIRLGRQNTPPASSHHLSGGPSG